jgi:hypothetical protein
LLTGASDSVFMSIRTRFSTAAAALACAAFGATSTASARTIEVQEGVSQNWAGYVVSGSGFSTVSGSWIEPSANCSSGAGDAAFWVGLGGSSGQSNSLEQTGTQIDCTSSGEATQYAWYELVPKAPVKVNVPIHSGDKISARVTVDGTNVTLALTDNTTGQTSTQTLQMSSPDTSSAEWIAEAPSECDATLTECQPLNLADFGKVSFSDASATTSGHTGTISDSAWTPSAVEIGDNGAAGAQPSNSNSAGDAFSVSYTAGDDGEGSTVPTSTSGAGGGGYGSYGGYGGYGGGYGYGGYGGGYGYGYGGYTAYGYGY